MEPAGLVLLIALATQAPQPVTLQYERAEGAQRCPDQEAMERAVTARLGRNPFAADAPESLSVRIEPAGDGLSAKVERLDAQGASKGKRELTSVSRDCVELASAIELALVLAIDPRRALARPESPAPPPAPAPPKPPAPSTPTQLTFGLEARGVAGTETGPTAAAALLVGVTHGPFELDGLARLDLPTSLAVAPGRIVTSAIAGELSPCYRFNAAEPASRPLSGRFGVCSAVLAGVLRASGEGFSANFRQTAVLLQVGARGFGELSLTTSLALRFDLAVRANLLRASVVVDAAPVWTTPDVSGDLGVTLLMRVP